MNKHKKKILIEFKGMLKEFALSKENLDLVSSNVWMSSTLDSYVKSLIPKKKTPTYVVGYLPPEATGFNACRQQMIDNQKDL